MKWLLLIVAVMSLGCFGWGWGIQHFGGADDINVLPPYVAGSVLLGADVICAVAYGMYRLVAS